MFCCTWFSQPLIATLHSDLPDQWNWTSDNPTGKNNRHESSIKKQCRTCVFNQKLAVWQDFAAWTRVVGFPYRKFYLENAWQHCLALMESWGFLGVHVVGQPSAICGGVPIANTGRHSNVANKQHMLDTCPKNALVSIWNDPLFPGLFPTSFWAASVFNV